MKVADKSSDGTPKIQGKCTERVKAYFISDMHLGAPHMKDSREREQRLVRFLDSIKDDATHLYLLGDVLDYWYEYRYVVPKGYVRFFGKLAELSDRGIKVTWLIGNHDIWIYDYIPNELGIRVVDGVLREKIGGTEFLMTHGDGVGEIPRKFRFIRSLFRNRVCQRLFSMVNPRWTIPFAYAWSAHSRAHGLEAGASYNPLEANLTRYTEAEAAQHPEIRHFVYGHLHVAKSTPVSNGATQWILGDWLTHMTYAVFDGNEMQLNRWYDSGSHLRRGS